MTSPGEPRSASGGWVGPVLVNYLRQYQIERGVPKASAYNITMDVMAVLLVLGFVLNYRVKPPELPPVASSL